MQSIVTKYHPPTNSRPARMSASTSAQGIRKYYRYDCGICREANHQHAALSMFKHMDWYKSTDVIYGIEQPANVYNWQASHHCSVITFNTILQTNQEQL